ncbi:MAG: hypothetical protein NW241_10855 [Bacteroidia bacterium]|nr:hypothetical protein [Bacteroidia bacterium]
MSKGFDTTEMTKPGTQRVRAGQAVFWNAGEKALKLNGAELPPPQQDARGVNSYFKLEITLAAESLMEVKFDPTDASPKLVIIQVYA